MPDPCARGPSRRAVLAAAVAAPIATTLAATGCAASPVRRLGLFTSIGLSAGEGRAELARAVGFDHLVTGVGAHLLPERPEAEFAARLARLAALAVPVRACNVFLPGTLRVVGPTADHDAVVRYAGLVFARARRAGVERIVFGSAAARTVPQGFAREDATRQLVALLRRLGPLAEAHGVLVLPENLNASECNFLNRVSEVVAVVAAVDHPAVRATADLYHMAREGEAPAALEAALPWLAHLEIAERERRTVPGTAGDDFRPWFRVLLAGGWSGTLNVEAAASDEAGYRRMFATLAQQIRESAPPRS